MSNYLVTNLDDSGVGSFRQALIDINEVKPASAFVFFNVFGVITLLSDLPHISSKVRIDGRINALALVPGVQLNFNMQNGLVFSKGSDFSEVYCMSLTNSKSSGVTVNYAKNLVFDKNYVGLDLEGNILGNKYDGITIYKSQNISIGKNITNSSEYVSNYISGNDGNGISVIESLGVVILSNTIGLNIDETVAFPNKKNGIHLHKSAYNQIGNEVYKNAQGLINNPTGSEGRTTPTFIIPPNGNLISGNLRNGIFIDNGSCFNVLCGNFIGTDLEGNGAIGNGLDGVLINCSDNNSLIGCKVYENPFSYYNVISGNLKNGLEISSSNFTTVQANFFGIGANNNCVVPNGLDGIVVNETSKNSTLGGVIPLGNNSSGNSLNGLRVSGHADGVIVFNLFAGLYAFGGAAPNAKNGIKIECSSKNVNVRTCVISGNTENGIKITDNASFVSINPCIIGLSTNGDSEIANGKNGVMICDDAHHVSIDSYKISCILNTTISGNNGSGVYICDNVHSISVKNSTIGLNFERLTKIQNKKYGIKIQGNADKILIEDNNISGNDLSGIFIGRCVRKTLLKCNTIGKNILDIEIPNGNPQILDLRKNC